jgi:ATP sulfurylase
MKKIIISLIIGFFIGALLFKNNKKYLKVVEENKLLKEKIFTYENYTIESP